MPRSFNLRRSPRMLVRTILGALVAANLIAAALVLFPPGGSAENLEQEQLSLESQIASRKAILGGSRRHAAAVAKGGSEGDKFLSQYFLPSRTAFSTVLTELDAAAGQTKIRPRDRGFSTEPIEGSDTLSTMSISAVYEGGYADVMRFVHQIDQSPGLLILESLSAAPQQNSDVLTVSMKLDTFVRQDGGIPNTAANTAANTPANTAANASAITAAAGQGQ